MLQNKNRSVGYSAAAVATFIALLGSSIAPANASTPYDQAVAELNTAASTADRLQEPVIYQSTTSNPLPAAYSSGDQGVVKTAASVTFIPNASRLITQGTRLETAVLPDDHRGAEARCENDPNAFVGGFRQASELYTPEQAYSALKAPDILFNTNYFDVRPQRNGETWQKNKCSSPLGMYYSNFPRTATDNEPITGNDYFAGVKDFVSATDVKSPLDTFFFIQGPETNEFELVTNSLGSKNSLNRAEELNRQSRTFLATSGTSLLPYLNSGDPEPDSGSRSTTRIALAYDRGNDRLILVQGGGYKDGFTRDSLQAVMRALNASMAVEFDGGGSAAVAVRKSHVTFTGASASPVNFDCAQEVCYSKVTQPGGQPRPVPGWMGLWEQ